MKLGFATQTKLSCVGFGFGATRLQLNIAARWTDSVRMFVRWKLFRDFLGEFGFPAITGRKYRGRSSRSNFSILGASSILRILSKVQMKFPFKAKSVRNYPRHEVALSTYSRKAEFTGAGKPFHRERKRERGGREEGKKKKKKRYLGELEHPTDFRHGRINREFALCMWEREREKLDEEIYGS